MPSSFPTGIPTREIGICDCYQLFDYELCSSCPWNGFVVQKFFSPVQLALVSWHANNGIYKLAIQITNQVHSEQFCDWLKYL